MRTLPLAFAFFFSTLLSVLGQEAAADTDSTYSSSIPSSISSSIVSVEARGGLSSVTAMLTFELQLHPFNHFSIDAGFRPLPFSLFGGISYYPVDHLFVQMQSGYMELTDTPGPDAPVFENDLYGLGRIGVLIGKQRGVQLTASIGGMLLVDHDYCSNCGFVNESTFVPRYRDEVKWLTTFELGVRVWP